MYWYVKPRENDIQHATIGAAAGVVAAKKATDKNAVMRILKNKLSQPPYRHSGDQLVNVTIDIMDQKKNKVKCTAIYKTSQKNLPTVKRTQWISLGG